MDELEFYNGEFSGLEIDRCISRVHLTPRNGRIPFIWKDTVSVTGTAGSQSVVIPISYQEPSGAPYQFWPHSGTILDVEMDHPEYLDYLDIGWAGGCTARFRKSGTVNITFYFVEYPQEVGLT